MGRVMRIAVSCTNRLLSAFAHDVSQESELQYRFSALARFSVACGLTWTYAFFYDNFQAKLPLLPSNLQTLVGAATSVLFLGLPWLVRRGLRLQVASVVFVLAYFCCNFMASLDESRLLACLVFTCCTPAFLHLLTSSRAWFVTFTGLALLLQRSHVVRVRQLLGEQPVIESMLRYAPIVTIMMAICGLQYENLRLQYTEAMRANWQAAEAANAAKNEFIASMSHEIRNPLNALLGCLHLFGDKQQLGREDRELVGIARDCGATLLDLLTNVLDTAKMDADKLVLSVAPVNLKTLFRRLYNMFRSSCHKKKLLFAVCLDELPDAVLCDGPRLMQVLVNLVGNAVKFTLQGAVRVSANWQADAADPTRGWLRVQVADTGIGMTEQARGNLFHKFYQADSSISRRFGGTGLGLYIAHRLVALMGGSLEVESQLGKGSRFHFTAPLVVCNSLPDDVESASNSGSPMDAGGWVDPPPTADAAGSGLGSTPAGVSADSPRGRRADDFDSPVAASSGRPADSPSLLTGLRLLVVDDNAQTLAVTERILRQWGCDIATALSGESTLAQLCPQSPQGGEGAEAGADGELVFDVMLLDLQMPEMDGYSTLRQYFDRCRQQRVHPVPVIVVTGNATDIDRQRCLTYGVRRFLVKPLEITLLRRTLCSIQSHPRRVHTVLAVDDDPMSAHVLVELLRKLDVSVCLASGGAQALELLRERFVCLVLMDVTMPDMDGYETTRRLRAWERERGFTPVPVVGLSGHTAPEHLTRCRAAGMNEVLVKPVRFDVLGRTVIKWLAEPKLNGFPGD